MAMPHSALSLTVYTSIAHRNQKAEATQVSFDF